MEVNNPDQDNFRQSFNLSVFLITEMNRPFLRPNVVQYEIEKKLWYIFYKEKRCLYVPFFYKNKIRELL